jgi:hypothetical protein
LLYAPAHHITKAEENETLSSTLADTVCGREWAITLSFYAAVHYVEAYFGMTGRSTALHFNRIKEIKGDAKIGRIANAYEDLQNLSEDARYEIRNMTSAHLKTAQEKLEEIKKVVKPLVR